MLALAVGWVWLAAALFGTNPSHLGGGDAANYANASEQYTSALPAGREFLPPELQAPAGELIDEDRFARLVRPGWRSPGNGIMTSFVFVSQRGPILYPHAHLSPRASALVATAGGSSVVPFLSYVYLAIGGVLMGCVAWTVTGSRIGGLLASLLYVSLPSHVDLARYPMSEPLTAVLVLTTVLAVLRMPRRHVALGLLPLALLPHAREEFELCVLVSILVLAAVRPRWWSLVVGVFVLTSWVSLTGGTTSPTPLTAFSIEPALPWPTPEIVAEGLAKPSRAGHLALPFALISLALSSVHRLRAVARSGLSHGGRAVHARPWVPIALIAVVVALGDVLKARMTPGQTMLAGVIRQARFATGPLLWQSTGLLLIVGVVGLALALPRLVARFGIVGGAWLLPLLAVFVDMHATPTNPLWWTRRFHQFAYPALAFGASVACVEGARWVRARAPKPAVGSAALLLVGVAFLVTQGALIGDRYPKVEVEPTVRSNLARTHDALDTLPEESVILYGHDGAGQKLQHLSRTFHGHYSFVVWDPADVDTVIAEMLGSGRPVFVDEYVIEKGQAKSNWEAELLVPSEGGYRGIQLGRATEPESRPQASGTGR
ncbi:MAG: hypothetical protein OSA99_14085 [Acidimicrobiales bacterium]|nr:hypothetical protein [Acidimicrobiales bacterium]